MVTKAAARQIGLRAIKQAIPLAIGAICLWVLWDRVQEVDVAAVLTAWQSISAVDWILAFLFTIVSFRAVSQYDVLAHRQFDTGLPPDQARLSGATAIALSQTLGFGLITGALARWRLMGGHGPGMAALVTGFVSVSFLIAMVALVAVVCLVFPVPDGVRPWAWLALATCCLVALGLFVAPRLNIRGHEIELPSLRAWSAAHGWAAIDIVMAGLALWILIPDNARPDFVAFLPVFCMALGAGLISGTPAGLGPFELVLLALSAATMPAETEISAMLVAVLGFRLVYFAVPAVLAALRLALPHSKSDQWRDPAPPPLTRAPRAESALVRQTGGRVEPLGSTHAALWPTGQALVAMYDPFHRPNGLFFRNFKERAKDRNRTALMYKVSARTAVAARAAGWSCLHGADDAVVSLASYTTECPERAKLRRKLRKAANSGLRIRLSRPSDEDHLAKIDRDWQAVHGRARGGTMGRFCPGYLAGKSVFLAEISGVPVAFVTFHRTGREWALDLMRHKTDIPDGTMHALVHHGILNAREAGALAVSLSAVPACPDPESAVWRELSFRAAALSGSAGLRQFKSSFAPDWHRLYLAAPSRRALVLGTLDLAKEVFWPRPVPALSRQDMSVIHHDIENYEVASKEVA